MRYFITLTSIVICVFIFFSNANAEINRIVLSNKDMGKWEKVGISRLGIDDDGNIYVLFDNQIPIFDKKGKNINIITLSKEHVDISRKSIIVFDKSKKILLQGFDMLSEGVGYKKLILNMDGSITKSLKESPVTARKKTCFNYFLNQYNEPVDLLDTHDKMLHSFEDVNRNYYERTRSTATNDVSLLQKKNPGDNIIWEVDFNDYIDIIGIDYESNVYIQRDDYMVFRLNQDAEVTGLINAGEEAFFPFPFSDQDKAILRTHFASEEPFYDSILGCSGDIYITYSFWQLPPDAKKLFQNNGKYFITKIAWNNYTAYEKRTHAERAIAYMKSKEYDGDKTLYSKKNLFIDEGLVSVLSKSNAKVIRNEIYARHGRKFKSKDLKDMFKSTNWYKPDPNYSDNMLNDIEKKNVQFILDYEKKMGWR